MGHVDKDALKRFCVEDLVAALNLIKQVDFAKLEFPDEVSIAKEAILDELNLRSKEELVQYILHN